LLERAAAEVPLTDAGHAFAAKTRRLPADYDSAVAEAQFAEEIGSRLLQG